MLFLGARMISFFVIVNKVFANCSPQRILTQENHSVQAFLLDGRYESFGESV